MQRTASPPHFCCTADDQRVWYGSKSTIGISLGAGTGSNAAAERRGENWRACPFGLLSFPVLLDKRLKRANKRCYLLA